MKNSAGQTIVTPDMVAALEGRAADYQAKTPLGGIAKVALAYKAGEARDQLQQNQETERMKTQAVIEALAGGNHQKAASLSGQLTNPRMQAAFLAHALNPEQHEDPWTTHVNPETGNSEYIQESQLKPGMVAKVPGGAGQNGYQFGRDRIVEDEQGNKYMATSQRNPSTGKVEAVYAPMGGAPATPVGALTILSDEGLTPMGRVQQKGMEAGAAEKAKLEQQLAYDPQITRAVETVKQEVELAGSQAELARSNESAWNVYTVGIGNLKNAFDGASTGYIQGWMPAVTTSQQKIDSAISLMGPILKQMFRVAGEGNWTDADQKLLMGMIPDRGTGPEAATVAFNAIDTLVRMKLGVGEAPPPPTGSGARTSVQVGDKTVEFEQTAPNRLKLVVPGQEGMDPRGQVDGDMQLGR